MEIEKGFADLIDDILLVLFLQNHCFVVLPDEKMKINVHMLKDQIYVHIGIGFVHFQEFDNIRMIQLL